MDQEKHLYLSPEAVSPTNVSNISLPSVENPITRPPLKSSQSSFKKVLRKVKSLANLGGSKDSTTSKESTGTRSNSNSPLPPTLSPTFPPPSPFFYNSCSVITTTVSRPRSRTNSSLKAGSVFSFMSRNSSTNSLSTSEFGSLFEGTINRPRGMSLSVPGRKRSGSSSSLLSSTSGGFLSPKVPNDVLSFTPPQSPSRPPPPFLASTTVSAKSNLSGVIKTLSPFSNETPASYTSRIGSQFPRSSIAVILSASGDPFFAACLSVYLDSFDFASLPLDVSLRQFLLSTTLPTETQQIDRVMESFALRYHIENPGLAINSDTFYVLAFSLIMLSTDLFNPNNKNKMSKASYIKNTSVGGVGVEYLEYLYDQISQGPFEFANENENNPQDSNALVDLSHLKIDISKNIPLQSPFSFTGTQKYFNASTLHLTFANAPILQIPPSRSTNSSQGTQLKIVKVGCLSRKDDLRDGKKVSSRKWKMYSVVLSNSQLLFFKVPGFASLLEEAINTANKQDNGSPLRLDTSLESAFQPDAALSLTNCIAVYDSSYTKYGICFRLISSVGEFLFQASDEQELCSWIQSINFAASFKSADIRMRTSNREELDSSRSTPSSGSLSHSPTTDTSSPSVENSSILPSVSEETVSPINKSMINKSMSENKFYTSTSPEFSISSLTRADALRIKIIQFESEIVSLKASLQDDLRRARNLAIFLPLRTSTRENLLSIISVLSKNTRLTRLNLAKFVCYREVLSKELLVEDRESAKQSRRRLWNNQPSRSSTFLSENFSSNGDETNNSSEALSHEATSFESEELYRLRSPPSMMLRSISEMNDTRFRSLPSPSSAFDFTFKSSPTASSTSLALLQ